MRGSVSQRHRDASFGVNLVHILKILQFLGSVLRVGLELDAPVVRVRSIVQAQVLVDVQRLRLSELRQHLRVLRVVRPRVNNQFLTQLDFPELVGGHHAFYCQVKNLGRVLLNETLHVCFFQTTEVLCVVTVLLLVQFIASGTQVRCVNDNHMVATIGRLRVEVGLVLAADVDRGQLGEAAQGVASRIKQVPGVALVLDGHIAALWVLLGHVVADHTVESVVRNFRHTVADVRVELETGVLWLGNEGLGLG